MKKNHVALITNCIEPNTKSGPITQFTREYRIKSLVKNLNFLISNSIFREIYIVDPFMINEKKKLEFESILKNNGLLNQNLEYILFNPEKNLKKKIIKRGKGYSEVAMLMTSLIYMNKKIKSKNTIVHKISGRYKVLNLEKIIKNNESKLNNEIMLNIPISVFLRKCYSVMFSFNINIDISIFAECMSLINDEKKSYLEHAFYKIINKKIKYSRNRILPKFERSLIGGSMQGRYNIFKQTINSFIYRLF